MVIWCVVWVLCCVGVYVVCFKSLVMLCGYYVGCVLGALCESLVVCYVGNEGVLNRSLVICYVGHWCCCTIVGMVQVVYYVGVYVVRYASHRWCVMRVSGDVLCG